MKFIYKALGEDGKIEIGEIEGKNQDEVVDFLRSKDLKIITIKKQSKFHLSKTDLQNNNLKEKSIILLTRELSMILKAGLDLKEALKIIKPQDKKVQRFIKDTLDKIEMGHNLSSIWEKNKSIPHFLVASIKSAEYTGLLDKALYDSSIYLENKLQQKEKIKKVLMYPAMLLFMLFFIMMIMFYKIVPTFQQIFLELDIPIPLSTKILFTLSNLFNEFYYIVFIALLGIIIFAIYFFRKNESPQGIITLFLKIPYTKRLIQKQYLINFASTLDLLYSSGINIEDALKIIGDAKKLPKEKELFNKLIDLLNKGQDFTTSLNMVGIDEPLFLEFIKVGEESGQMSKALKFCHDFLKREMDNFFDKVITLIEPILILIVGIMVGTFIFALVVPLFDIPSVIGA